MESHLAGCTAFRCNDPLLILTGPSLYYKSPLHCLHIDCPVGSRAEPVVWLFVCCRCAAGLVATIAKTKFAFGTIHPRTHHSAFEEACEVRAQRRAEVRFASPRGVRLLLAEMYTHFSHFTFLFFSILHFTCDI